MIALNWSNYIKNENLHEASLTSPRLRGTSHRNFFSSKFWDQKFIYFCYVSNYHLFISECTELLYYRLPMSSTNAVRLLTAYSPLLPDYSGRWAPCSGWLSGWWVGMVGWWGGVVGWWEPGCCPRQGGVWLVLIHTSSHHGCSKQCSYLQLSKHYSRIWSHHMQGKSLKLLVGK